MTGVIYLKSAAYFVRDDHGFGPEVWAWDTHADPGIEGRVPTHKWLRLPRGRLEVFDVESPPATVSYRPLLASYF